MSMPLHPPIILLVEIWDLCPCSIEDYDAIGNPIERVCADNLPAGSVVKVEFPMLHPTSKMGQTVVVKMSGLPSHLNGAVVMSSVRNKLCRDVGVVLDAYIKEHNLPVKQLVVRLSEHNEIHDGAYNISYN